MGFLKDSQFLCCIIAINICNFSGKFVTPNEPTETGEVLKLMLCFSSGIMISFFIYVLVSLLLFET